MSGEQRYDLIFVPFISQGRGLYYFEAPDQLNLIQPKEDETSGKALARFMRAQQLEVLAVATRAMNFRRRIVATLQFSPLAPPNMDQWRTLEQIGQSRLPRKDKQLMKYVAQYLHADGLVT